MIVQEKLAETRITAMRLFIMTNKAKKDLAIKELTNPVSFDNLQNPTRGGVYDPALGCYKSGDCETCGLPFACPPGFKMNTCPGHFGGIKLPLPVYSPYTFDFVLKILKTICLKCTRFAKRESECVLFVKQMEAIQLSLLDLCDKMSEIHEIFDQEYGAELQNKKLQDFTEQLDKCIQNAAETAPIDATTAYSKNIEGILQEFRKARCV